jgi:predicted RecB family nuclease
MAMKITRDILESYLQCKYKAHLKLAKQQGIKADYELLLLEFRNRVRMEAADKLVTRHKQSDLAQGLVMTLKILKHGASLLLDASVEDEELSICFDALQKGAGPSMLGNFHYIPVLFHEAERPSRLQKDLLELYGLIIGDLQGRHPDSGVLIHGRGCNVRRFRLKPNGEKARQTMQGIREIQRHNMPPRLLLNNHCQICEFRQQCHADAIVNDDLSLLGRMREKEIKRHNSRGIFTVTQLSCTFRARKRSRRSKEKSPRHDPALQALAIREKKIYVIGTPELPSCSTRIYLDIEGDPERRFAYLLGIIIDRNGAEERHSFWSDAQADEPRLFQQFVNVLAQLDEYRLYSYGSYEAAFLRRMIKESGWHDLAEKMLIRSINVLSIIYAHVYFPTYSNSLKQIARYLGFMWTEPDASGIQSLVWRKKWEVIGSAGLKEKLATYNMEDCVALRQVTEFLYTICSNQASPGQPQSWTHEGHQFSRVEEIEPQWNRREWCKPEFSIPDFEFINERAYFDYQRDRVFIRTSKSLKKSSLPRRRKKKNKKPKANHSVEISAEECPFCGGTALNRSPDSRLARWVFDLRFRRSGIRRYVTRFTTSWHWCDRCGERFLPRQYLRLDEHSHSLKSWAMYEHVAHRTSYANIAETIKDCFGFSIFTADVHNFKLLLSRYYDETYKELLRKIVAGKILHADETEVHVRGTGKGYVWVFTNLEEVFFVYRQSREGSFLCDMLKDFRGVLISDFYAAYDSLPCEQQKCLIHLMRDFNHDLLGNPWDEDLKSLAAEFGRLLCKIVATVDQYGLRQRHFGKHRRDVERFFRAVVSRSYRSEVTQGYAKRLLKYQEKLFTFLNHDSVPWNNNNAEHALKKFADYREIVDGRFTEAGLNEYLVLLSIYLTCRYKGISFLRFLLSREKDIDAFRLGANQQKPLPVLDLCPEGFVFSRRKRKPDWDQKHKRLMASRESSGKHPAALRRAIRVRLA